jgi:hypothetical protein
VHDVPVCPGGGLLLLLEHATATAEAINAGAIRGRIIDVSLGRRLAA